MPAFRPALLSDRRPLTPGLAASICAEMVRPAHFYVGPRARLRWTGEVEEEVFWEIYLGRVLDRLQTRERRRFTSWNVHVVDADGRDSAEPLISLKTDRDAGLIHVTRAILCHAHETVVAAGNVVETREAIRWQRELVGSIPNEGSGTCGELRDELACLLFQAVVGLSRLPLTSLEAPLPAFSLGQLGYCYRREATAPGATAMQHPRELASLLHNAALAGIERTKVLELLLRSAAPEDLPEIVPALFDDGIDGDPFAQLRAVVNEATLSPWTEFVANALAVARHALSAGLAVAHQVAALLAHCLRQLSRHLTAYDLITFHHRGANYPDALFLDLLLADFRSLVAESPDVIAPSARLSRRGWRMGLLLCHEYRDHAVPDAPTSPGENARVLPEPFPRVPDDQIFAPSTRKRRLFTDRATADAAQLRDLLRDLDDECELRELGTALYLDRPFGAIKQSGEPDQTLLMAHILFSRSVAERRIQCLASQPELLPDPGAIERWLVKLAAMNVDGLPLTDAGPRPRPGVVSLHDAFLAADDWLVVRTTRRAIDDLLGHYDFEPMFEQFAGRILGASAWRILLPVTRGQEWLLTVLDDGLRPVLELHPDFSSGYWCRGGGEALVAGLRAALPDANSIGCDTPSVALPPK